MRGDYTTLLRLVLLGNRSIREFENLSLLTHKNILGFAERYTHLCIETKREIKTKKWIFISESKSEKSYITISDWKKQLSNSLPKGFFVKNIERRKDDRMLSGIGGGRVMVLNLGYDESTKAYFYKTKKIRTDYRHIPSDAYPSETVWDDSLVHINNPQIINGRNFLGINDAKTQFTKSMQEILDYAVNDGLNGWVKVFSGVLDLLNNRPLPKNQHDGFDIAVNSDSHIKNLLNAISNAWVFEGMGSWNDYWPPEEKKIEYERVSDNLFRSIHVLIEEIAWDSYIRTIS